MIYLLILVCFLALSSSNHLVSSNKVEASTEEDANHSKESFPHAEIGRKSKAIDLDDWYYWQNRKWQNRRKPPSLPPYPGISNYDQYSPWYPPPPTYLYPPRSSYKPLSRRNSIAMGTPLTAPSSNSYSTTDTEGIQGVFAKWNPKINLTWPPSISVSSTNEYPDYSPSASYHHNDHDHDHYRQIQFIPIHMPCHHDHHHGKKKEISLIWPLIFLGLLFLPLLLGALLLPLAFLFITNIIQLLNLLQRLQQPNAQQAGQGGRKKRSLNYHPLIDEQIQMIADRLEKSLVKFLYLFSNDKSKFKSQSQSKSKPSMAPSTKASSSSKTFKLTNANTK